MEGKDEPDGRGLAGGRSARAYIMIIVGHHRHACARRAERWGPSMSKFKSKTKRMFSGTAEYHKLDIARGQLETAIRLFLVDGCDMFSAITLAGAGRKTFVWFLT